MKRFIITTAAIASLAFVFSALAPEPVLAQQQPAPVVKLEDPLNLNPDAPITDLVGRVIQAFLGIIGIVALIMFVYGGTLWLVAAGKADRVTRGKDIFIWSIIGLVVIFSSYAITTFVIDQIVTK